MGALTTKELIDEAEAQLNLADDRDGNRVTAERILCALQSIAASQLVIARASAGIRAK